MSFITRFWQETNLPESGAMAFEFSLEELFTNIFKYGLIADGPSDVRVSLERLDGVVRMVISDPGPPFDPVAEDAPNLDLSLDERELGGLGIFLLKEMMDQITYDRVSDRNVVTLVKSNLCEK